MVLNPFIDGQEQAPIKTGIGVSIVLFNPDVVKLSQTLGCLKEAFVAFDKAGFGVESLLFLIDNSVPSLDRLFLERLIESHYFGVNHPRHKVIIESLGKNVGYGTGHNLAIRSHCFKYHLIINPDVYLKPDTLLNFYKYAEARNDVVLLSPKVLSRNGSIQYLLRRDPTPLDAFLRFLAIFVPAVTELRRYKRYECRDVNMSEPQEGYILSGCCMWCRTDALKKVGCFDERFFLYWEDYDLSKRLNQVGRTVYLPYAQVIHDWDRTMTKSPRLMFTNVRSAIRFFYKWRWEHRSF